MSKKKATTLSAIDRAFAAAGNFPSKTPTEFRRLLEDFRKRHKYRAAQLGIQKSPSEPIIETAANREMLQMLRAEENSEVYAGTIRDLALGCWYDNKIVYHFTPQAVQYIDDVFRPERLNLSMNRIIWTLCKDPVYLEFPNGSSLQGAFCSCVSLLNDSLPECEGAGTEKAPLFVAMLVRRGTASIYLHMGQDLFLSSELARYETEDDVKYLLRALSYLAFCSIENDGDRVIVPYQKGKYDYKIVSEVPFPDCREDRFDYLEDHTAWMRYGLCSFYGYLSRENMVKAFTEDLKALCQYKDYSFPPDGVPNSKEAIEYKIKEAALSWEDYRTIYQYDKKTEQTFRSNYMSELGINGFPDRLVDYMPYPTIVLNQKDSERTALISLGKVDGPAQRGIFIITFGEENHSLAIFPTSKSPFSALDFDEDTDFAISALCAFYHILTVLEAKTLKRLAKEQLMQGDPAGTALVAVIETQGKKGRQSQGDGAAPEPVLRMGPPLEDIPFEMYDLTPRTVKHVPNKTVYARHGWNMRPHSRRAHPHRYWVGSGEDKHLEVRWLEKMKINAKERPIETTTVHDLK